MNPMEGKEIEVKYSVTPIHSLIFLELSYDSPYDRSTDRHRPRNGNFFMRQ
jgi:hypothetical protein